jgi:hypothetical protein
VEKEGSSENNIIVFTIDNKDLELNKKWRA